jgi:hypothetical protein
MFRSKHSIFCHFSLIRRTVKDNFIPRLVYHDCVDQQRIQAIEIVLVAGVFACAIIFLSRRGRLSFRYGMGWLALSGLSAFGGIFLPVIEPIAARLRLDAFSLVSALAVIVLLSLCIQLSISISGMQRQIQTLNEDLAIQKKVLDELRDSKK